VSDSKSNKHIIHSGERGDNNSFVHGICHNNNHSTHIYSQFINNNLWPVALFNYQVVLYIILN